MKKIYLMMLACITFITSYGQQAELAAKQQSNVASGDLQLQISQGMTVINHSNMAIYFKVTAKALKDERIQYASLTMMANPNSKMEFGDIEKIQWVNDIVPQSCRFVSFAGSYIDPSGGCTADATNLLGNASDKLQQSAMINAGSCGNGDLKLQWSTNTGRVIVTID